MTALQWIETKAVPAIEKWWKPIAAVVGFILVVVVGKGILRGLFGKTPAGPPPADAIVAKADAEKARIAQEIKADSAQGVADAFNSAVKKTQP